jgi:K(+)-stimulated pyrophosphate-energized sodium pump
MVASGVLLGVFMVNAGGAWDNAKKMIEDEPRDPAKNTGKGSERHKAAVTGDTVGDPLKDTAGPAINPMVKVMNMVAMLTLGVVLSFNVAGVQSSRAGSLPPNRMVGAGIALVAVILIVYAVLKSKKETAEMKQIEADMAK